MPLTAVGKIFKLALRLDAIRRCVCAVAAHFDDAHEIKIEVRDVDGGIAVVLTAPGPPLAEAVEALRRELERYTFRVEVEPARFS